MGKFAFSSFRGIQIQLLYMLGPIDLSIHVRDARPKSYSLLTVFHKDGVCLCVQTGEVRLSKIL